MEEGYNLICGDTNSDLAMVKFAMEKTGNRSVIFVTKDEKLQKEVIKICPNFFFVPAPDFLIAILNNFSKRRNL